MNCNVTYEELAAAYRSARAASWEAVPGGVSAHAAWAAARSAIGCTRHALDVAQEAATAADRGDQLKDLVDLHGADPLGQNSL